MSLSRIIDINICAEYLLVDGCTHGTGGTAWIVLYLVISSRYHLSPCFFYNLTNEFLQGLLGLGIRGECLFQYLLLLQYYCIIDFE